MSNCNKKLSNLLHLLVLCLCTPLWNMGWICPSIIEITEIKVPPVKNGQNDPIFHKETNSRHAKLHAFGVKVLHFSCTSCTSFLYIFYKFMHFRFSCTLYISLKLWQLQLRFMHFTYLNLAAMKQTYMRQVSVTSPRMSNFFIQQWLIVERLFPI